ncbi:MAG: GNAT family N-acetyltransferase [Ilumatobacteraceae bacterium]
MTGGGRVEPLLEVALIGAGPTASTLLERLAANAPEFLDGRSLRIHLVDPHRAGTGRVWRPDLHPGLWMNSMAEDVTLFTDASVQCEGPIRPGPSLHEWAHTVDDDTLASLATPALIEEIRAIGPMTFPTRLVQSVYLDWFHRRVVEALPPGIELVVHTGTAIDVADRPDGRQVVRLRRVTSSAGPDALPAPAVEELVVDEVVLSLGHLDAEPDADVATAARFAARHGVVHLPPGHTAELDLSVLEPGADVIALGFGQAFTDLLALVTEGRGGRFVDDDGGQLRYLASGHEPILHVGSRRGVPYRSKMNYRLVAPAAPLPRFLDDATIDRLTARGSLDFRRDVLPLVSKEVGWAHYHELFHAHPERTTESWASFAARFADAAPDDAPGGVAEVVRVAVPDAADRFDIARLDRPLHGTIFETAAQLHDHVRAHVVRDVARRTDPSFSADLGAFNGLLSAFGALARLSAGGAFTPRSRVDDVGTWWFSFFMYYASGPPPERLRQLVALADAGLVRFIGESTTVTGDDATGTFIATSTSHPERIRATALVDARVATASVSRTTDEMLRRLRDRGDVVEEVVADEGGWRRNTGKVLVTGADLRVVRADGTAHPRRHALGVFTSRPAAGAFARPRTNAPAFRQNDTVARSVLRTITANTATTSAATTGARTAMTCGGGGHVLDNVAWHALTGPHAAFAEGSGAARRYRTDVSVFHALLDDDPTSWADLAPLVHSDGTAVIFRALPITPPAGWAEVHLGEGLQMVSVTPPVPVARLPAVDPGSGRRVELRPLTDADVPAMIALIALTEPGPFRPRTIELGGYVGIFHDDELVAMAGQRMHPPGPREISAVCTHPSARRRGYASIVTAHVAREIAGRGETPFLHLASQNDAARATYEQIGFELRTRVTFGLYRHLDRAIGS